VPEVQLAIDCREMGLLRVVQFHYYQPYSEQTRMLLAPGSDCLVKDPEMIYYLGWSLRVCREDLLRHDGALADCVVWQEPLSSEVGHG
jgi:hypothetical protein